MQYRAETFRASILSLLVLLCLPLGAQTGKSTADTDARTAAPDPRGAVNGEYANAAAPGAGATSIVAGIQTNARDGVFPEAQTLWFSLATGTVLPNAAAEGDELRLYRDGEEVYRGAGPTSLALDVAAGSERFFDIRAERRSLYGTGPVEATAQWAILVDRAPPPEPRLSVEALSGGTKRVRLAALPGTRVRALVDAPGYPQEAIALPEEILIASDRFHILAWAIDEAGNESAPALVRERPARLELVNPLAGLWANRQLLYLESEGLAEILWTADGSDPLLGGGRPYRGPERIERTGTVYLRVAARTEDGQIIRRETKYAVREGRADPLAALEGVEFAAEGLRSLALPEGFSAAWAASLPLSKTTGPRSLRHAVFGPQKTISLPPSSSLFRREPLVVCDDSSLWRFVVPLGGRETAPAAEIGGAFGRRELGEGLSLLSTAHLRALSFDGTGFLWRFSSAKGAVSEWSKARRVLPLPREEGVFEWFPARDEPGPPRSFRLAALAGQDEGPVVLAARPAESRDPLVLSAKDAALPLSLELVLSSRGPGDTRVQRRGLELPPGETLAIEAAEGEELMVQVEGPGGRELGSWVLDRRAPALPLVEGPADGEWIDREVALDIRSAWPLSGSIRMELEEFSGEIHKTTRTPVPGVLEILPDTRGLLTVHLDFIARDKAGNESPRVQRSFTVDAGTVYLDTAAAAGTPPAGVEARGARDYPCRSLAEAVEVAGRLGRRRIAVRGAPDLDTHLSIPGSPDPLLIEGGFLDGWNKGSSPSRMNFAARSSLRIGARPVFLRDLHLQRPGSSPEALVSLEPGSSLALLRTRIDADSLLVRGEGARLSARFSLFSSRTGAFDLRLSSLSLEDSLVSIKADTDGRPAISLEAGLLRAERVQLSFASSGFATGVALVDSEAALVDCGVRIAAGDFVTALEARGGRLTVLGGELAASARDVVIVSLNDVDARFRGAELHATAAGVSRAFDVRVRAPELRSNVIINDGSALQSEFFAGMEPGRASVSGNRLSGWYRLSPTLHADTDLPLFNRRHAGMEEPNSVDAAPETPFDQVIGY